MERVALKRIKFTERQKSDFFLRSFFDSHRGYQILSLPGRPFYMDIVNQAVIKMLSLYYPSYAISNVACAAEKDGDQAHWFLDTGEFLRLGKRIARDKKMQARMARNFDRDSRDFFKRIRRLEKAGIRPRNLETDFLTLAEAYMKVWASVYILTGAIHFAYGNFFIAGFLKRNKYSPAAQDAISSLTRPTHDFIKAEDAGLRRMAARWPGNWISVKNPAQLKIKAPGVYDALVAHQKKYYWIRNNYQLSTYLSLRFFFARLRHIKSDLQKLPDRPSQRPARALSGISARDRETLSFLGRSAGWQDIRKQANICANYWLKEYLSAISRKYGLAFRDSEFASFAEITNLLKNGKIDAHRLVERKKGVAFICFQSKDYWFSGPAYEIMKGRLLRLVQKNKADRKILQGHSANKGRARGRVRIIINVARQGRSLKKGEILVTSMTRPEFVPLMRIAKAIITQEGGVTSHAAVISRELDIPCIVGVEHALTSLHDGDLVEVKADEGLVRVLD